MSEKSTKSRRRPQPVLEQEVEADSDSSGEAVPPNNGAPPAQRAKLRHQKSFGWEVVEGLREGNKVEEASRKRPQKLEGYLLKRRKWPMKGWHKRYFVLDNGLLSYAKSPGQLAKGRYHGQVDVGLSVVSFKQKRGRIDIDADTIVHHIKITDASTFDNWVSRLRWHRLYRQLSLSHGPNGQAVGPGLDSSCAPAEDLRPRTSSPVPNASTRTPAPKGTRSMSPDVVKTMTLSRDQGGFTSPRSHASIGSNRLLAWVIDCSLVDKLNKDLSAVQSKLFDLNSLMEGFKSELALSTSPRRQHKRFLMRRKRSDQTKPQIQYRPVSMPTSTSNPNLQSLVSSSGSAVGSVTSSSGHGSARCDTTSLTGGGSVAEAVSGSCELLTQRGPLDSSGSGGGGGGLSDSSRSPEMMAKKEKFMMEAAEVTERFRRMARHLAAEKEKIRQMLETQSTGFSLNAASATTSYVQSLKSSLSEALMQNSELRMRLARIRAEAEAPIGQSPSGTLLQHTGTVTETKALSSSLSRDSITEFFDAPEFQGASDQEEEDLSSDSEASDEETGESEAEEEEEEEEDVSQDDRSLDEIPLAIRRMSALSLGRKNSEVPVIALKTGRRDCLPAPQPDTSDFSLMNLLCKNIGRDLSRVRLPVLLNEPLNALQRLCEELEYSELLDHASRTEDPIERTVYVAAFAVSAYTASFYRSGAKPFNPLQGETYECVREDKGWKFVAEQVSHHPPISAMHCEAPNWQFWQDLRIKNKFWGKSIEAVPVGKVHLHFPKLNEHYTWSKVTTCIHNIFSTHRYVDHYGEMQLEGRYASGKLVFQKGNGWWGRRHEVTGEVWTNDLRRKQSVFGKWTEGLYCGQDSTARCIWRPGSMPEDHELYYGLTRFAIELNHLDPAVEPVLPPTDTRFRPDQRLLEEGDVKGAEEEKTRLEEAQRTRRKEEEKSGKAMEPLFFRPVKDGSEEHFEFTGKYWQLRRDPGFSKMPASFFPNLFGSQADQR